MIALLVGASAIVSLGLGQDPVLSRDDTIEATHRFADCVVGQKRNLVVEMLEQVPNTVEERRIAGRFANTTGDCLNHASRSHSVEMRFRPYAIRGYFAEALFARDFSGVGRARHQGRVLARLPDLLEASRQPGVSEVTRTSLILGAFASCIVETEPEKAARLLRTHPTAEEETEAFQALHSAMSPCYPQGQTLTIVRPMLRGFIAEGLYRHSARLVAGTTPETVQ